MRFLRLALLASLVAMSGCAEFNAAWQSGTSYANTQVTAQQSNIQAANDVAAKVLADSLCAVPYGEMVRNGSGNPNFVSAVVTACGSPSGYYMAKAPAVTPAK